MKFADEAILEVLEFDMHEELGDFKSLWQGRLSQTKCKIFGDLQKAAGTFCLEVGVEVEVLYSRQTENCGDKYNDGINSSVWAKPKSHINTVSQESRSSLSSGADQSRSSLSPGA